MLQVHLPRRDRRRLWKLSKREHRGQGRRRDWRWRWHASWATRFRWPTPETPWRYDPERLLPRSVPTRLGAFLVRTFRERLRPPAVRPADVAVAAARILADTSPVVTPAAERR